MRINDLFYNYEPDPDPDPPATGDPGTVLSADEVRSIVSEAVDERLNHYSLGDRLAKLDILDDLAGRPVSDSDSLVKSIDNAIANRLKTFNRSSGSGTTTETDGTNTGRKAGPLGRWLGLGAS